MNNRTKTTIQETYAYAIIDLSERLASAYNLNKATMLYPFFDGPILGHIVQKVWDKKNIPYIDQINNIIKISSKSKEFDRKKFEEILDISAYNTLITFDLRTGRKEKEGSLQDMLEKEIELFNGRTGRNISLCYAVVFDKWNRANIFGVNEALENENRITWVSKEEYDKLRKLLFFKSSTIFDIHMYIEAIDAVKNIGSLISEILI